MSAADFQVGPEMWTTVTLTVTNEDGDLVAEPHEVSYVHGYGRLFPLLEDALEGCVAGGICEVTLPASETYGERDPAALVEFERDEFPPDVAPGDRFDAERDDGSPMVLMVVEVAEESVTVDLNHPLAGQSLHVEAFVEEVRPATGAEIAAAEAALLAAEQAGEASPDLVPLERLLQAPSRG